MCLSLITSTSPKKTSGIGYKVLRVTKNGGIFPQYRNAVYSYPVNQWMQAKEKKVFTHWSWGPFYRSGFHILKTRADARKWKNIVYSKGCKIFKVEFKEAHTVGRDNSCDVIIARHMKILEEIS